MLKILPSAVSQLDFRSTLPFEFVCRSAGHAGCRRNHAFSHGFDPAQTGYFEMISERPSKEAFRVRAPVTKVHADGYAGQDVDEP